jgi:EAL domain-containing protein (putative c-di-GMP-specific phosphodiesterase class I)
MNTSVLESIELVEDMKNAIENNEFIVYYQPVVEILTGKIIGAEALVRWIHPIKGFLPPDMFISIAEKSGLIVELGEWVLKQACLDTMAIQNSIMKDFFIAVNVSPVQIKRDDFIPRVESVLSRYPLTKGTLELELTESGLVSDSEVFNNALEFFTENNISISIDDFGTGYSNLSYLQRINASKLKIDRCFVTDIGDHTNNRAIVSAISSMSAGLTLRTVAEGVESLEELMVLQGMDITYGQGYYWSRPVPIDDFRELLLKQNS